MNPTEAFLESYTARLHQEVRILRVVVDWLTHWGMYLPQEATRELEEALRAASAAPEG